MNGSFVSLAGRQFGRWTVISLVEYRKTNAVYKCRCECGTVRDVWAAGLKTGRSRSCGCLMTELAKGRGKKAFEDKVTNKREYWIWVNIKQRCQNPKASGYSKYGGRGIAMCERWAASFDAFLADMGARPTPGHSVDRVDNCKGYSPENCRWATGGEQSRNRRSTRFITFDGRTQCASDWAKEIGIAAGTLFNRFRSGWTVEKALTTPKLR